MKNFRTLVPTPNFPFQLHHQTPIVSIGSCFAEHIGARLERLKFPICRNPFGILYNPMSIGKGLQLLLEDYSFSEKDLVQHNGIWHSFQHHSQFSGLDKAEVLANIRATSTQASKVLHSSNRLILTFGTAYVYEHLEQQEIVANCHKIPATKFQKRRLDIAEIVAAYRPLFQKLKTKNSEIEILLTVSPVRHIRDGIIENQRSKATLLLAIDALCEAFDFVHYFPAYEIVMDDLRDYRFYQADLLHPSEVAIDYVWEVFEKSLFSEETKQLNKQLTKLQQAATHRPFHVKSDGHQAFLKKQLEKIAVLSRQYTFLDFREERLVFEEGLMNH